jgi:hypothetical protein
VTFKFSILLRKTAVIIRHNKGSSTDCGGVENRVLKGMLTTVGGIYARLKQNCIIRSSLLNEEPSNVNKFNVKYSIFMQPYMFRLFGAIFRISAVTTEIV